MKRIDVEIVGESSGDHYSALKLSPRFRRYSQATLVVKLSFKVVQVGIPFSLLALNLLVPWFFVFVACSGVTHYYPLTTSYYPQLPTDNSFSYKF